MLNYEEVLAIACVAEPVGVVEPDLERPEGDFVHGRALLQCRKLLFGKKLQTFQQSTGAGRSVRSTYDTDEEKTTYSE